MKTTTNYQKLISFSPVLYQLTQQKADEVGLSFQEYIRYLLVTDVQQNPPMVDLETDQRIHEAMKEYRAGKGVLVDPSDPQQLKQAAGIN